MLIGVPKEIKTLEHRVGLVPSAVKEFVACGHEIIVETGAGDAINFTDDIYEQAGAKIVGSASEVFARAEMIIKVKEPQPQEYKMLREGQILFTFLHLAAEPELTQGLIDSGCIAIAYETVTGDGFSDLPLLQPMSEIAGRLSVQVGAYNLQKHMGGKGRLISGVPGVKPAKVLIVGGGVAGFHAAQVATGIGANVTILEKDNGRMRFLDEYFHGRANIVCSNIETLGRFAQVADVIIGAVLIPGATAPKLITRDMLSDFAPGTVMVDVSIDQGGCFETSRSTTHAEPTYMVDDIVHYCVANMPGAVPLTSSLALNHSVLPYALELAEKGWKRAILDDQHFRNGLNVCQGEMTHEAVAESLDLDYNPEPKALAA